MKHAITILALLTANLCNARTAWEKIEINPGVSISFPAKSLSNDATKGQKTFILKYADSTANYVVAANDLSISMGIDDATLATEMEKEESWEQAKIAFMGRMGTDATLVKDELTTIKEVKAFKLIIDRKNDKGVVNTLTVFIFVQGTVSYNIIFNNKGGKADEKMKEQFFDSLEIK